MFKEMQQILLIVLPVFCVVWLGYGLKIVGLLHERLVDDLNRLLYYVALPALLFYKIATAGFEENFTPLVLLGLSASTFCVCCFAYWYGGFRNYSPAAQGAFAQAAGRGNLAYVGLAIVFSAYGESGVTKAGILLGFIIPAMSLLSMLVLLYPLYTRQRGWKRKILFKELLMNPIFLGSFLGIGWSYFSLPLPLVLEKSLSIFTSLSLPLALLVIGGAFSFCAFRGSFLRTLWATVLKLVVLPLICGLFLVLLGVGGDDLGIGILLAGTPTAIISCVFARQLGSDSTLSANVIMLSTVASIFTYAAILCFLQVS